MNDIVKKLHADETFKRVLAGLEDDEQKKMIVSFTETFVSELHTALQEALERIENDKSLHAKLKEALVETHHLFTGSIEK